MTKLVCPKKRGSQLSLRTLDFMAPRDGLEPPT